MGRALGLGPEDLGSSPGLLDCWVSHFPSLSLCFFVCKVGIWILTLPPFCGGFEAQME